MNRSSTEPRRGGPDSLLRRLVRCERGQDVAEMAMVLPFLLVVVLGVVEFGTMFGAQHTLTSLGREGANIAARGASLDTVTALMLETGQEIGLATQGGVVSSLVQVIDGEPVVMEQVASEGHEGRSRLGAVADTAVGLDRVRGDEGASFYVVELFYAHEEQTPLRNLLGGGVPDTLYSRAIF